jgi:hypothetical protein
LQAPRAVTLVAISLLLCVVVSTGQAVPSPGFIENRGQAAKRVAYYMPGGRATVYFTADAVVFDLHEKEVRSESDPTLEFIPRPDSSAEAPGRSLRGCAVYIRFNGANPSPRIEARGELETRYNYFLGNDPSRWRSDVPTYAEVVYHDLWPGVDLVYADEGGKLTYKVVTSSGGASRNVGFEYQGAASVIVGPDGSARIATGVGVLLHEPPKTLGSDGSLAVEVGANTARSDGLRDDPSALLWSTFLGGSSNEYARALALDSSGNSILVGLTASANFPTTPGAYDTSFNTSFDDVFVAKLSSTGGSLLWGTFLGGSSYDYGFGLALDSSQDPVLTGYTQSSNFPTTKGAYDTSYNGIYDGFVAKLSSTGSSLLWSTFLGGNYDDYGYAIALDSSQDPIVTGYTSSSDFPTTPGAYDTSHNGYQDVFVAKLSSTGSGLLWSTLLGGSSDDDGFGLALDSLQNPVLTGITLSSDFPTTPGAYDTSDNGGLYDSDVFVAKLSSTGSSLLWSTYLGGSTADRGCGLALDSSQDPVLTGRTQSSDFPTTPGAYDTSVNGTYDGFVAKLSSTGSSLLWSTFLGGSSDDYGHALALDSSENAILMGTTGSADFPTTPGAYDTSYNGSNDIFVAKLSSIGSSLLWSTFLGGTSADVGQAYALAALALDSSGNPILIGSTGSADFPTTTGAYDTSYNGGFLDGFVAKLQLVPTGPPAPPSNLTATTQGPTSILLTWQDNSDNEARFDIERKTGPTGSWELIPAAPAGSASWEDTGVTSGLTYCYRIRAWNSAGYSAYCLHQAQATAGPIPASPTALAVVSVTATSITLQWHDHACNESGFWIERKTVPEGVWEYAGSPGASDGCSGTVTNVDFGVVPSTTYQYRVRAYNIYGSSSWTDPPAEAATSSTSLPFAADVYVKLGLEPIGFASIYVNDQPRGSTTADGRCRLENLHLGDKIKASKRVSVCAANKLHHEAVANTMYELWLDTDVITPYGNYLPDPIEEQRDAYTFQMVHPVFRYNLVVSVAWDITQDSPAYWGQLLAGFNAASSRIYDATDGQVQLNSIAVYDCGVNWNWADMVIKSQEQVGDVPQTFIDAIYRWYVPLFPEYQYAMSFSRTFIGNAPDQPRYYTTIAHEFCHYALGMYDEDRDGNGSDAAWQAYRNGHPQTHKPWGIPYGVMDAQAQGHETTEMSSSNDYPHALLYHHEPETMSLQYYNRLGPCWKWLAGRLEGFYSGIHVAEPEPGWYPGNQTADREGPDAQGMGIAGQWIPLDYRGGAGAVAATREGTLAEGPSGHGERRNRAGPRAVADAAPTGDRTAPGIRLDLWPDTELVEDPLVVCHHGATVDTVSMTRAGEEDPYSGVVSISLSDSLFHGAGWFDVSLSDVGGTTTFPVDFRLGLAGPEESLDLFAWQADLHLKAGETGAERLSLGAKCGAAVVIPAGFEAVQVTDSFSFHLSAGDSYPSGAGINIHYDESQVAGLDERSLGLFRWSPQTQEWIAVPGSIGSLAGDVVSAVVNEGGTYGVFASESSEDQVPPGSVADLGAVEALGQGAVMVDWTAPGDDGTEGTAVEYQIAYADAPITQQGWAEASKVLGLPSPQPAGAHEAMSTVLPEPGHLYYLAVRTKDEAGNLSPLSNATYTTSGIIDPNFRPGPPLDFRAVDCPADSGGSVSLSWSRSYDDGGGKHSVVEYRIYRDEPLILLPFPLDTVSAGTTSYRDTTAALGQVHTYWVSSADTEQETLGSENRAYSARNLGGPIGDFSSDGKVGVDDFGLMVNTYGIDSTDVEYDPLYDLDHSGDIYTGDFELFRSHFGEGGVPSSSPVGQNAPAQVLFDYEHGSGEQSFLNLRIEGASNVAGYSFKVSYPAATLSLASVTADSVGITGNLLNQDGGLTPLFLTSEPSTGVLWIANAIKGASAYSSPEGEGFLARISFTGSGIEDVTVTEVALMDCDRLLNYLPVAIPAGAADADALLRPHLFQSYPNPFNKTTTISFSIPQSAKVSLKVFDVQGRLVRTLVDGVRLAGVHPIVWDRRSNGGQSVASGVYFYRLKAPGFEKSRRMVLLK